MQRPRHTQSTLFLFALPFLLLLASFGLCTTAANATAAANATTAATAASPTTPIAFTQEGCSLTLPRGARFNLTALTAAAPVSQSVGGGALVYTIVFCGTLPAGNATPAACQGYSACRVETYGPGNTAVAPLAAAGSDASASMAFVRGQLSYSAAGGGVCRDDTHYGISVALVCDYSTEARLVQTSSGTACTLPFDLYTRQACVGAQTSAPPTTSTTTSSTAAGAAPGTPPLVVINDRGNETDLNRVATLPQPYPAAADPWQACGRGNLFCRMRYGDGVCHPACNTLSCLYDGADCAATAPPAPCPQLQTCTSSLLPGAAAPCLQQCDSAACGFAAGACGAPAQPYASFTLALFVDAAGSPLTAERLAELRLRLGRFLHAQVTAADVAPKPSPVTMLTTLTLDIQTVCGDPAAGRCIASPAAAASLVNGIVADGSASRQLGLAVRRANAYIPPTPTEGSSTPAATLLGAVLGGLVALLALAFVIFMGVSKRRRLRRSARRKRGENDGDSGDSMLDPSDPEASAFGVTLSAAGSETAAGAGAASKRAKRASADDSPPLVAWARASPAEDASGHRGAEAQAAAQAAAPVLPPAPGVALHAWASSEPGDSDGRQESDVDYLVIGDDPVSEGYGASDDASGAARLKDSGASSADYSSASESRPELDEIGLLLPADKYGRTPLHRRASLPTGRDTGHAGAYGEPLGTTLEELLAALPRVARRVIDLQGINTVNKNGRRVTTNRLVRRELNRGDDDGATALALAARHDQPEHVAALLKAGAGAGASDHGGRSPLHWAAVCGADAVVRRLLTAKAGRASALQRDRNGDTAFELAAREGCLACFSALMELGPALPVDVFDACAAIARDRGDVWPSGLLPGGAAGDDEACGAASVRIKTE